MAITEQHIVELTGTPADALPWEPKTMAPYPNHDQEWFSFWFGVWGHFEHNFPNWIPDSFLAGFFTTQRMEDCFNHALDIHSAIKGDSRKA